MVVELMAALALPAMSLVFGILNGARLVELAAWIIPLAIVMLLGFFVLPGPLGDAAIAAGIAGFLLTTLPTGFGDWWIRHVLPPRFR
jgi:hypothetical protein